MDRWSSRQTTNYRRDKITVSPLHLLAVILPVVATAAPQAQAGPSDNLDHNYRHASAGAYEKWRDLKYGVRIHWGVYSLWHVEASWPFHDLSNEKKQEYQQLYRKFNPTAFSAEKWMQMFERWGVKCFAFTAKHHDGFSMFDTKTRVRRRFNWLAPEGPQIEQCDLAYSIMETPFHRDIVKELCDAAHKHGIAIDLYFSHPDWYDADFRFDKWNVARDPGYTPQTDPDGFARFAGRHKEQIRELLTNYGKIDMMCLDMHLPDFCWPALKESVMLARRLQPDVLLRKRGIGAYGDYMTPERWAPHSPDDRRLNNPWMVIDPLGETFAYQPDADKYRTGSWILSNLIDIVAKGGLFMPCIGPDEKGLFHPQAVKEFDYVGDWLKVNGEAIHKTRPWKHWKEGKDVWFTCSGNQKYVYAICRGWPGAEFASCLIRPRRDSQIVILGVDEPLKWQNDPERGLVINVPERLQSDEHRPCRQYYVFKIAQEPAATVSDPG